MSTDLDVYDVTRLPATTVDSLVRPAAETEAIKASFRAYSELCEALLDKDDYQRIGRKDFRKKSGWRKLGVAFGVSLTLVDERETRNEQGRIVRSRVVVRATAPNGRACDGLGICDVFEKCCPGADGDPESCPSREQNHKHCKHGCPGKIHFSGAEHDVPATAYTRAANRASSDLFGMGEVSAEEITNADREAGETTDPYGETWARQAGWQSRTDVDAAKEEIRAELKAIQDDRISEEDARVLWADYLKPDKDGHGRPRTLKEHQEWIIWLHDALDALDTATAPQPPSDDTPVVPAPDAPSGDPGAAQAPPSEIYGVGPAEDYDAPDPGRPFSEDDETLPLDYRSKLDEVYLTHANGDLDALIAAVAALSVSDATNELDRRGGDPFLPDDQVRRDLCKRVMEANPVDPVDPNPKRARRTRTR